MATANVIELETCVADCLEYCRKHPEREFVAYFLPRLEHAKRKWEESVETSDRRYLEWQREFAEDKIAWKRLGAELRGTQKMLRRVGALGYPSKVVYHWDEEILTESVGEMVAYLEERRDVIEGAAERIESLRRCLDAARGETTGMDEALHDYNRYVLFRAEAMGTLNNTLASFRVSMRRALGKSSEEYRSIRWPITLAPDEPVL